MATLVSSFNSARINLKAITENYRALRQSTSGQLMVVLKGDAYGHGLLECANALVLSGAAHLGVLDVHEAMALAGAKYKATIHILAGLEGPESMRLSVAHDFVVLVYSWEQLSALAQIAQSLNKTCQVRIKIDTGMGRLGFHWEQFGEIIGKVKTLKNIKVLGLATHLPTCGDSEATWQLKRFTDLKTQADRVIGLKLSHSALASGGLLAHPDYEDDLTRVGLLLYGYSPLTVDSPCLFDLPRSRNLIKSLKPVMSVKSQVIQVRTFKAGETVGYDRTYRISKDIKVATAPIGYLHGISRHRSSRGFALIGGRQAPLLGRVSMNLSTYDVSQIAAMTGNEVVIFGEQGGEKLGADLVGSWQDTSPYEVLVTSGRLNNRVYD